MIFPTACWPSYHDEGTTVVQTLGFAAVNWKTEDSTQSELVTIAISTLNICWTMNFIQMGKLRSPSNLSKYVCVCKYIIRSAVHRLRCDSRLQLWKPIWNWTLEIEQWEVRALVSFIYHILFVRYYLTALMTINVTLMMTMLQEKLKYHTIMDKCTHQDIKLKYKRQEKQA